MQKLEPVTLKIEHLLVELSLCVNDLQVFRQQLSLDDAKQTELNLNKLELLISTVLSSGSLLFNSSYRFYIRISENNCFMREQMQEIM